MIAALSVPLHDNKFEVRISAVQALRLLGVSLPDGTGVVDGVELMTEAAMISVLCEVARASTSGGQPGLESSEQRYEVARAIGRELYRRGGMAAMKRALDEGVGSRPGQRTIDGFWDGIGEWRG